MDWITYKIKAAEELQRRKTKNNYANYVEYVHEGRWILSNHLLFVCNKVQKFIETVTGHAFDILIIQMPPQHGKSQSVTETLPSWFLGKWPYKRVIEASYNDGFAQKFGRRNRDKVKKFGKQLFDIEISKVKDSNEEFELNNNVGGMISRGIMSGITGNPAELIIIDDPIKNRQEADSETYRENLWEEWDNSIKTRLAAGAKVIVIMTRWHEDDLAGRLIMNLKNVEVINIPCEAEENDVLGREIGEALFPEIGKDKKWLQEFKKSYTTQEGQRAWLALFQGRPTAQEGNMIKRHWWKYWKLPGTDLPPVTIKLPDGTIQHIYAEDLPDYWDEQIQSWDCAFKDNENNDFVCGGVWGRRIEDYFLLDLINERMDIVQTMAAIEKFAEKWPKALKKLIEDKANGPAVIQMLQKKMSGIIEVQPEGGKEARVSAVSPAIESGNVYIPHPLICAWVNTFLDQCSQFPNAMNDDMVDMTSQALNKLIYRTKDTKPTEGITGKYFKTELIMKGLKEHQIKKLVKEGKVELLGR